MSRINFLPASRFKGRPAPDGCFVVPDIFIPHLLHPAPVQIWYGSRYSAKSYTKADEMLAKAASNDYFRGIYARQNKEDVKNSQYQLFKDKINRTPWLKRQFVPRDSDYVIENTITGNKLIPGSFDHPEKIMSIADPTDIWVEEPITRKGEIKRSDFFDMFGSLRNPYGVAPKFHFTFNPISIHSWIYTDFFDKQTIPSHRLLANYDDNPFCPASAFEFFGWLQAVDPDRYLIDAKGKWGVPKPENPYFRNLNHAALFQPVTYDPRRDVYISMDFNNVNSVTIRQKQGPKQAPKFLRELHQGGDGLDLRAICKEIAHTYGRSNYLHFTGDASGRQRRSETEGNKSAWQLITKYMEEFGAMYTNYEQVPQSNLATSESRFICNALIYEYGDELQIDPVNCPTLAADVVRMKTASDGRLDKKDADKYDYGHLGDCFRYDLSHFEYSTFKSLGSKTGQ